MQDVTTVLPPPLPVPLLPSLPPARPPSPTHHPICHSSLLSFLHLLLLLFVSASSLNWMAGQSGALLPDALARAAHLAVQLHHLEDGLLAAAAQMVEQTVVLLG